MVSTNDPQECKGNCPARTIRFSVVIFARGTHFDQIWSDILPKHHRVCHQISSAKGWGIGVKRVTASHCSIRFPDGFPFPKIKKRVKMLTFLLSFRLQRVVNPMAWTPYLWHNWPHGGSAKAASTKLLTQQGKSGEGVTERDCWCHWCSISAKSFEKLFSACEMCLVKFPEGAITWKERVKAPLVVKLAWVF